MVLKISKSQSKCIDIVITPKRHNNKNWPLSIKCCKEAKEDSETWYMTLGLLAICMVGNCSGPSLLAFLPHPTAIMFVPMCCIWEEVELYPIQLCIIFLYSFSGLLATLGEQRPISCIMPLSCIMSPLFISRPPCIKWFKEANFMSYASFVHLQASLHQVLQRGQFHINCIFCLPQGLLASSVARRWKPTKGNTQRSEFETFLGCSNEYKVKVQEEMNVHLSCSNEYKVKKEKEQWGEYMCVNRHKQMYANKCTSKW